MNLAVRFIREFILAHCFNFFLHNMTFEEYLDHACDIQKTYYHKQAAQENAPSSKAATKAASLRLPHVYEVLPLQSEIVTEPPLLGSWKVRPL